MMREEAYRPARRLVRDANDEVVPGIGGEKFRETDAVKTGRDIAGVESVIIPAGQSLTLQCMHRRVRFRFPGVAALPSRQGDEPGERLQFHPQCVRERLLAPGRPGRRLNPQLAAPRRRRFGRREDVDRRVAASACGRLAHGDRVRIGGRRRQHRRNALGATVHAVPNGDPRLVAIERHPAAGFRFARPQARTGGRVEVHRDRGRLGLRRLGRQNDLKRERPGLAHMVRVGDKRHAVLAHMERGSLQCVRRGFGVGVPRRRQV